VKLWHDYNDIYESRMACFFRATLYTILYRHQIMNLEAVTVTHYRCHRQTMWSIYNSISAGLHGQNPLPAGDINIKCMSVIPTSIILRELEWNRSVGVLPLSHGLLN